MKKMYYSQQEFDSLIQDKEFIDANEGKIIFVDDLVYKIIRDSIIISHYTSKSLKTIKKIAKLDSSFLTTPLFLINIKPEDSHKYSYEGFAMNNEGDNLLHYLRRDDLSFEDKVKIANQLKEIYYYLQSVGYAHGDIRLPNVLFKDGTTKLTDINGMLPYKMLEKYDIRMPALYRDWLYRYGEHQYVDYLAINLCMHLLFNYKPELLQEFPEILNSDENELENQVDIPNTEFDKQVFDTMKNAFNCKEKKLSKGFLVDYLR